MLFPQPRPVSPQAMLIFDACSPTQLIKNVLASCKYCCQGNVRGLLCCFQMTGLVQAASRVALSPECLCVSVCNEFELHYPQIHWVTCVCVCVCVLIHAALAHLWCSCQRFRKVQNWRTGFNAHNPTFLRSLCPLVIWSNVTFSIYRTYCHIPTPPFTSVASTVI